MVRILCQSFTNFKIKKDSIFDGILGQISQTNKFKASDPEGSVVHESLKSVKYLSYNYLFQTFHALDMLLNSLTTRQ